MTALYYFAYGSNLHPLRLQKRVPSAVLMGAITMPGYQLRFHKRHHEDNSGKCNMLLTNQSHDVIYGALYQMEESEKPLLDLCEGEGYRCDTLQVRIEDKVYESFVYIAEDSHIDDSLKTHSWYQEIVLLGAQYHQLPEDYLSRIREINVGIDPDQEQHDRNSLLIEQMRSYRSDARASGTGESKDSTV